MASSVSSERVFLQGGITVSKHCNRLKGDIVEALQCIKCAIHHDILFCEAAPSSVLETQLELEENGEDQDGNENDGGGHWRSMMRDGMNWLLKRMTMKTWT